MNGPPPDSCVFSLLGIHFCLIRLRRRNVLPRLPSLRCRKVDLFFARSSTVTLYFMKIYILACDSNPDGLHVASQRIVSCAVEKDEGYVIPILIRQRFPVSWGTYFDHLTGIKVRVV